MPTADEVPKAKKDFFVSYTGADRAWAEWIAWELEESGYSVIIQAWDFHAGENSINNMQEALEGSVRTLAVLSEAYFDSAFCKQEWTAALAKAAKEGEDKLLPVRITNIDPPGLFAPIAYIDLLDTGQDEAEAKRQLLSAVKSDRGKPDTAPGFPGQIPRAVPEKPRFPGALPAIWNLPHQNRYFTGREALLQDLRNRLTSGSTTAVTQAITGLGGIGKSELATEYAYRFKDDYLLAWWVRAEERATMVADVMALARKLDLPEKDEAQQDVVLEAVRRWLHTEGGWLLIYDNVPDEQSIEDFVPRGATGHVIITSRDTRWDRIAAPLAVDLWERSESVAFLRERTGESDDREADKLAELLGDLPLALEQAAAYVKQTRKPLGWYADQLEKGHGAKLWAKGRDAEKTVAATWTLSFERVAEESPAGAALLQLCAFLAPDDIPLDVIHAGAEHLLEPLKAAAADDIDFEDAVAAVLRYSLARRDGEGLSVHRLVQAVTRDRLDEQQRGRWAERAMNLIRAVVPGRPHGVFDAKVTAIHGRLLPHALATVEHAETANVSLVQAASISNEIGLYQRMRADLPGALASYKRGLALIEKIHDQPGLSALVNNVGLVLLDQRDFEGARSAFRRALGIDQATLGPYHSKIANDINNLGMVFLARRNLRKARKYFEWALKIDEKVSPPDNSSIATHLNNLGCVLQDVGDLKGARDKYEQALAIDEKALQPDSQSVARDSNNLGDVLHQLGDFDGAKAAYERALAIAKTVFDEADHPDVACCLNNLGAVRKDQGDLEGARKHFERALVIARMFFPEDHPNVQSVRHNLEVLGK